MKEYVLFGAGQVAKDAIALLGRDNIAFILDNDKKKVGDYLESIPIYSLKSKLGELSYIQIVVSVSQQYIDDICLQLESNGIYEYVLLNNLRSQITREKITQRLDFINVYRKALRWIQNNSYENHAICCTSQKLLGYPEVTGYYIPTLLRWGYRDLAIGYSNWLLSIQKEDGSWYDTDDQSPYVFDSAQILKGLLAVYSIHPQKDIVSAAIIRGCEWILGCMTIEGRLVTQDTSCWGNNPNMCSELIHLYCLSPLIEAGRIFSKPIYAKKARKIFEYYKQNYYDKIMNFSLLSHFYAYVMEALIDLGEIDMAREAMDRIAKYQKPSGAVPAYNNVDWVCSTGLFQLALVWFRLEDIDRGNKAFKYACRLQNETGGWFGSYLSEDNPNEANDYFPGAEISWANKYFLDALYYKNRAEFEACGDIFLTDIKKDDERYLIILNEVKKLSDGSKILDVGCGKGRYIKNLLQDAPLFSYYGVDISESVLAYVKSMKATCGQGTLTSIPYEDNMFAVTYTCEALEHAIDMESSVREMCRVTLPGGKIVIVDMNDGCYGTLEIGEWEQWPNEEQLKQIMLSYCSDVQVHHGLRYENMSNEELFTAWIGCVK